MQNLRRIKMVFLIGLVSVYLSLNTVYSQETSISDGSYALPQNLPETPKDRLGYPDKSSGSDIATGFKSPPPGYGSVPFYWWVGEKLTKERLLWQLDILHEAGVQGLNVSYPHSNPQSDPELNSKGYGAWGLSLPSDPPFFSDEWWEIWDWFTGECAKRNMGVGLDDYTFNTPGNKQWPDDIAALPEMREYQGKLVFSNPITLRGGTRHELRIDSSFVSLTAFRRTENGLDGDSAIDLMKLAVGKNSITWTAPEGNEWQIIPIATTGSFMLHPRHGAEVIKHYFQKFEDHIDQDRRKGMNYFFQDELVIDLTQDSWSEDFAGQFRIRKGYDIRPYLAALHYDIGNMTPKIKMDHMDVVVTLAEERFFRPIFEWHWERGLIYGCDNHGRGYDPISYGDYFRATRWFTAPGNDAPEGAIALIPTKVSSSISHLYQRPRVWLEAFHSMGWDARPAWITEATDKHYLLGGNLLCLHGLYYTTLGGWWEWAPPDFHFRMPYWPHMKGWLKYNERLSYLLSQGSHVCDVAVVYPVSPLQAGNGGNTEVAFSAARELFDAGIDFDFIDYQSLRRTDAGKANLSVSGENYSALVLADMTAVRFTTLQRALELFRSGGTVIALGRLPKASDRTGSNDPEVQEILKELFGPAAINTNAPGETDPQRSPAGGTGIYLGGNTALLPALISKYINRDFIPAGSGGHVLHRRAGNRDIYMVMDVEEGEECFFRARGKAELWDPWTGESTPLYSRQTEKGSYLRIPLSPPQSSLIVFNPDLPNIEPAEEKTKWKETVLAIDGEWESEIVPTMNNRWGDFRLPAFDGFIGAEARQFRYETEDHAGMDWKKVDFDDSGWPMVSCSFGPRLEHLFFPAETGYKEAEKLVLSGPYKEAEKLVLSGPYSAVLLAADGTSYQWTPYEYSLRWGVENQPGSQGYHGLKGKINDDFIIMGEAGQHFFRSCVLAENAIRAELVVSGRNPDKVEPGTVNLIKGRNDLLFSFVDIPEKDYDYQSHLIIDNRTRSSVMLVLQGAPKGSEMQLASRWQNLPGLLAFDIHAGKPLTGCYRFLAPPGLTEMSFSAYGIVQVAVNGKEARIVAGEKQEDGLTDYSVSFKRPYASMSTVAIRIEHQPGYYGGAAVPEPVTLTCGKGTIQAGDWSQMGVLRHYSGGLWYRKNVTLKSENIQGRCILDLGEVVASCEVYVNGTNAGTLVTYPYTLDISKHIRKGKNRLEILVYNTLSNHYQSIPTPGTYKKTTDSGLIGPVKIITRAKTNKAANL